MAKLQKLTLSIQKSEFFVQIDTSLSVFFYRW